ncbi:MAG: hypothetical protein GXP25_06680 [Planctomycetes bacterium]|nr:hypothetical protein [Planctomycetota bacterium]
MEVKETGACGITERLFVIELEEDETPEIHKMLKAAENGEEIDKGLLAEVLAQTEKGTPEEGEDLFGLKLNETQIAKVYKMLLVAEEAAKNDASGLDADMLDDLLAGMEHIVGPSIEEG